MGFNLSRWALGQPALMRFLMVSLLILGIGSYFQLGQDEDPPFTFRLMVIQAEWPGATARQMADQVADRIERAVQDVPNIDKITGFSKPGRTVIIIQTTDDFKPSEVYDRFDTIRKKVTDIRGTLPPGVRGPFFNDDFGDTFGVIYALSAPDMPQRDLTDLVKDVRARLLNVRDVGKVETFGLQPEVITFELSLRALARYRITSADIATQIAQQNAVVDSGRLTAKGAEIPLRTTGQFESVEALAEMPIRAGRQIVRLGDLGSIRREIQDPPAPGLRVDGDPVVALGVSMQRGGDIIRLGRALAQEAERIRADLPVGVSLNQIQDQPKVVAESVGEFLQVLAEAVAIVLGVSLISLGLHRNPLRIDPRPGLIVAISIPLVMAVTFLVMKMFGVGIHKISLGSLIIALGLLVDDAIIVVEMMVRKLEEGADKMTAATAAYRLTAMPMLTGTLITAVGFLPIGIANSAVGEYTFAIFAVTAAALLISWVVSVIFVPVLGVGLLKPHPAPAGGLSVEEAEERMYAEGFYARFRSAVAWCVDHRWKTIAVTIVIFAFGVVGMGKVEQQFFPESSRPEVLVDLYLAEGSAQSSTDAAVRRAEEVISAMPEVEKLTAWIGIGAPRFFLPLDIIFRQENVAQMVVLSAPGTNYREFLQRLQDEVSAAVPEARVRVKRLPNGPPVPYPVAFRLVSSDPDAIVAAAGPFRSAIAQHPDIRGLNDNWNQLRPVAQIQVDLARARELGVPSNLVAQSIEVVVSGVTVGQYREDDKLLPIQLRLPKEERDALSDLASLQIPSLAGGFVPASKVASFQVLYEPGVLWRKDREYAMTLQAMTANGRPGPPVTAELLPALRALEKDLPPGVRLEVAGEVEEASKGQASIVAGLPIMFFITLTLLVLQLRSNKRAFMVLATAPLGLAGVAIALLVAGRPFGFVAQLGVIALMGMIMRNSVILIDQIEQELSEGTPLREAIVESTVRRFRPIILTAAAAILAMIPLSRSIFWGPMAASIMGGLVVATLLTLFFLPALVAVVEKAQRRGGIGGIH